MWNNNFTDQSMFGWTEVYQINCMKRWEWKILACCPSCHNNCSIQPIHGVRCRSVQDAPRLTPSLCHSKYNWQCIQVGLYVSIFSLSHRWEDKRTYSLLWVQCCSDTVYCIHGWRRHRDTTGWSIWYDILIFT